MRMVYNAWLEHERYEDMDEFDRFLVDEYEAERWQEKADRQQDDEEDWKSEDDE